MMAAQLLRHRRHRGAAAHGRSDRPGRQGRRRVDARVARDVRLDRLRQEGDTALARRTRRCGRRMSVALDILTIVAVSAGAFFFLAGTVGLLRFPDTLTRLHALTKADNLGLGLVVLGLLPRAGSARSGSSSSASGCSSSWPAPRSPSSSRAPRCATSRRPEHDASGRRGSGGAGPGRRSLDDRRPRDLRGGRRLRHLWLAADTRLGAPRRRRRGAHRDRDRQRLDRRVAARCGGPPAGHRDAGGGRAARSARTPRRCGAVGDGHGGARDRCAAPCPTRRPRSRRRPSRTSARPVSATPSRAS